MNHLTLDSLIDTLATWRETLPGDTPIAHALDDEGEAAELLGEAMPGFLVPHRLGEFDGRLRRCVSDDDIDGIPEARRALVLWPQIPTSPTSPESPETPESPAPAPTDQEAA